MRICVVYDCLYPHTIGGAERWYRNLALRLAQVGHDVTYLTMRQWEKAEPPQLDGVRVVAVAPRMALYANERRRIAPPLVFGLGVLRHLTLHGANYDVVHTASFPYFSLLAAASARPAGRYMIVVDWPEVWTRGYWNEYLGRLGAVGYRVQHLCVGVQAGGVLLLSLARAAAAGRGLLRPDHRPPRAVRGRCRRAAAARRAGRRVRGSSHPGEARHGRGSGVCTSPRAGTGPPVCCLRGRARASRGASADRPGRSRGRSRGTRVRGAGTRRAGAENRALSRTALGARRLRPSGRRGGGTGDAVGGRRRAGQCGGGAHRGWCQRLHRPERVAGGAREAIVRAHRAGQKLRETTASWFSRSADTLSLESSLRIVLDRYDRGTSPCV